MKQKLYVIKRYDEVIAITECKELMIRFGQLIRMVDNFTNEKYTVEVIKKKKAINDYLVKYGDNVLVEYDNIVVTQYSLDTLIDVVDITEEQYKKIKEKVAEYIEKHRDDLSDGDVKRLNKASKEYEPKRLKVEDFKYIMKLY